MQGRAVGGEDDRRKEEAADCGVRGSKCGVSLPGAEGRGGERSRRARRKTKTKRTTRRATRRPGAPTTTGMMPLLQNNSAVYLRDAPSEEQSYNWTMGKMRNTDITLILAPTTIHPSRELPVSQNRYLVCTKISILFCKLIKRVVLVQKCMKKMET